MLWEEIPFETQELPRSCGAACLAMVYRWLGRPATQLDIWPRIARGNAFGSFASITHLMAQDALHRGFSAAVVQARNNLAYLRACSSRGLPAILSVRAVPEKPDGHFVVFLGERDECFLVHDPMAGPEREIGEQELLALWETPPQPNEVTGGVLIAIGGPENGDAVCGVCHAPVPAVLSCPRCTASVGLRPLAAIGCIAANCKARLAARLCCPECDLLWEPWDAALAPAVNLGKLYAVLDKFVVATSGAAAGDADLTRLITQLGGIRSKLSEAVDTDMAARAKLYAQREAARAQIAADIAALRAQSPKPIASGSIKLDAVALGQALLDRLAV
jgi:hypothetical protein